MDNRRVLDGEPIGQFHQHQWRRRLGGVKAAHHVIDGFGPGDNLMRLDLRQITRVGQLGQVFTIAFEIRHRLVRAHEYDDILPPLVRLPDGHHLNPRRLVGKGPVVLQYVGVIGELLRSPHVVSDHVLRRGDPVDYGQVVDKGAQKLRPRRPLLDEARELVILWLRLGLRRHGDRAGEHH